MKNVLVYSLALVIASAPILIIPACSKSSDSTSDLVGNWAISDYFDGPARSEAAAFTINDTVFVGTGATNTNTRRYKDFWKYSIDKRYWTDIQDFKGGPRSSAIGFAVNGKGYVGTGYDLDGNYKKDMWQYSPDSNGWAPRTDFGGTARAEAVAFVVGNRAFVGTGYDDSYLKDIWEYNAAADSWSQKAGILGAKRRMAQVFVISNKAYLISGESNSAALNDMQVYDPAAGDSWTALRKLTNVEDDTYDDKYTSIARYNGATFVIDNKGYLVTGEAGSLNSRTWEYTPETDTWEEKTPFSGAGRTGAIGFTLKNRGFVVSGRSGTAPFDNMYELQPGAEDDDNDNL